jgi:gas vesicle protein
MATALERKPCAKCNKGGGVTTCDGCQQSFCIKHIIEHRQELALKMDNIGQEHDSFRHDLDEEIVSHLLLLQIDNWEEESIEKIKTAAKTARNEVRQILNEMKNDIKISVDKLADELQAQRESDDYTEIDLNRWSTALTDMRTLLFVETPSTIQICKDDNAFDAIHFIKVVKKPQSTTISSNLTQVSETISRETFSKCTDGISLIENDLLAIYADRVRYGYKTIFGKTLYQYGVHEICFRIENKDFDNFFFGIVNSSQNLVTRIFDTSTANGWWGFDVPVIDGKHQERCGEKILQSGDIVRLTLDCNNRQIRFENDRTKTILQLNINKTLCPLPWKIAVSLSRPHDALRILW